MIITIDGASWTGKSSTAKALAKLLNYTHINTGAMFRAVAYKAQKLDLSLDNEKKMAEIAQQITIEFKQSKDSAKIFVDGEDLTEDLNSSLMAPLAAKIANIPAVRESLLQLQHKLAQKGKVIFEGRDTGSVVFPYANWKFYITASKEIRMERFLKMVAPEEKIRYSREEVRKIIEEMDLKDLTRKISPLKIPEEAIIYDNSESPSGEQDAVVLWYYITHLEEIKKNLRSGCAEHLSKTTN